MRVSSLFLWIVSLASFCFISLHVGAQKELKTREYFVVQFQARLYSAPDRSSEELKTFSIFEKVWSTPCPSSKSSKEWVCVRDESNLAGFALSKNLLPAGKRSEAPLLHRMDEHLSRSKMPLEWKIELANSIFELTETGEYWGEEFLLARSKAGFALMHVLEDLNKVPGRIEEGNIQSFLKKHERKILFDFSNNRFYLDTNYFWKLIESTREQKHAESIAHLATLALPVCADSQDFFCQLNTLRRGKMRLLASFPESRQAKIYFSEILQTMAGWASEPENLPCYLPRDSRIAAEVQGLDSMISDLPKTYSARLLPYFLPIKKECGSE